MEHRVEGNEALDLRDMEAVFKRYKGLIYRCISKVLSRFHDLNTQAAADDIFQDVCIKIMKELHRYDPGRGAKLGTYIGGIAVNVTYDFLRKIRRSREHLGSGNPGDGMVEDVFTNTPADGIGQDEACYAAELARLFSEVRETLPASLQKALDYDLSSGEDPGTHAKKNGLTRGTVYSSRKKMQVRVRALLEERFGDDIEGLLAA